MEAGRLSCPTAGYKHTVRGFHMAFLRVGREGMNIHSLLRRTQARKGQRTCSVQPRNADRTRATGATSASTATIGKYAIGAGITAAAGTGLSLQCANPGLTSSIRKQCLPSSLWQTRAGDKPPASNLDSPARRFAASPDRIGQVSSLLRVVTLIAISRNHLSGLTRKQPDGVVAPPERPSTAELSA